MEETKTRENRILVDWDKKSKGYNSLLPTEVVLPQDSKIYNVAAWLADKYSCEVNGWERIAPCLDGKSDKAVYVVSYYENDTESEGTLAVFTDKAKATEFMMAKFREDLGEHIEALNEDYGTDYSVEEVLSKVHPNKYEKETMEFVDDNLAIHYSAMHTVIDCVSRYDIELIPLYE